MDPGTPGQKKCKTWSTIKSLAHFADRNGQIGIDYGPNRYGADCRETSVSKLRSSRVRPCWSRTVEIEGFIATMHSLS
jgi:hypothetical protein